MEKSTRWRQSSRRRVWQPRAQELPFFVLNEEFFHFTYGRKKGRIKRNSERFLTHTTRDAERDRTGTRTLSLSKELFFLYRLVKKEERKKKTKMHAATHHGQQSASFVSLGENGGKRHRLRARSCRLRSGERRSKKDRIRNNASSSNNSDAQDSIGNEEEEKYKTETKARANRLRAKVIKQYLGAMGEKTNDCFDKEDLVERLTRAWMAKS